MIYVIREDIELRGSLPYVKIGYAGADAHRRAQQLQNGNPRPLIVVATIEGRVRDEQALHARFSADRVADGEWFLVTTGSDLEAWLNDLHPAWRVTAAPSTQRPAPMTRRAERPPSAASQGWVRLVIASDRNH